MEPHGTAHGAVSRRPCPGTPSRAADLVQEQSRLSQARALPGPGGRAQTHPGASSLRWGQASVERVSGFNWLSSPGPSGHSPLRTREPRGIQGPAGKGQPHPGAPVPRGWREALRWAFVDAGHTSHRAEGRPQRPSGTTSEADSFTAKLLKTPSDVGK